MKTRQANALLIAALLTIAFAVCGGAKKASTPTEAFKMFYEATKNKDIAAIKSLIAKENLSELEAKAKSRNKSLDDYLSDASSDTPAALPQLGQETIEGDTAKLQFKRDDAANWRTATFVKEDGGWKLNFK